MKLLLAVSAICSTLLSTHAATTTAPVTTMCVLAELQTLMATPFTTPCMSESGLDFSKLTGAPTPAQAQNFCKSNACVSLVKTVLAKNTADCTIPIVNVKFRSELFNPLAKACGVAATNNATGSKNATAAANNATGSKNATAAANNATGSKNATAAANNATGSNTTAAANGTKSSNSTSGAKKSGSKGNHDADLDLDPDAGVDSANSDQTPSSSKAPTPSPTSTAGSPLAVSACTTVLGAVALVLML